MDTKSSLKRYVKAEKTRRAQQSRLKQADVQDLAQPDAPPSPSGKERNEGAYDREEKSITTFLKELDAATADYVIVNTENKVVFVDLGVQQVGTAEFRIAHPDPGVLSLESGDGLCDPNRDDKARSFASFKEGMSYLKTSFLEDLARHIAIAESMIDEPARRKVTDGNIDGEAWIASASWRRRYRFYRDVLDESFETTFEVEEGESFDPINDPRVESLAEAIGGINMTFWDDAAYSKYDAFGVEFGLQFRHLTEQYFVGFLRGAKDALEGLWGSQRDKKFEAWTYSLDSEE